MNRSWKAPRSKSGGSAHICSATPTKRGHRGTWTPAWTKGLAILDATFMQASTSSRRRVYRRESEGREQAVPSDGLVERCGLERGRGRTSSPWTAIVRSDREASARTTGGAAPLGGFRAARIAPPAHPISGVTKEKEPRREGEAHPQCHCLSSAGGSNTRVAFLAMRLD